MVIIQNKRRNQGFLRSRKKRVWPDIWIIATNINPSGTAETGTFDQAREIVARANPNLKDKFHIWGGKKIVQLLANYPQIADYYGHFLTPGNVLRKIFDQIEDKYASDKNIIRHLAVSQLDEQKYTKLEQAGSASDDRPGIHDIFIDLPFHNEECAVSGKAVEWLLMATSRCHKLDDSLPTTEEWMRWNRHPSRAKLWFIKGGPGQGKSTIGQYICQLQRASLIVNKHITRINPKDKNLALEIKKRAERNQCWINTPRIPVFIELKDYAQWHWQNKDGQATGILSYLSGSLSQEIDQTVQAGTLKRMLSQNSWLFVFDGLDEVPQDLKDEIAKQVANFIENVAAESHADLFSICTSRPQGYSGQFDDLNSAVIDLISLSKEDALSCAEPILRNNRSQKESNASLRILRNAIESPAIKELMTTPLQAHIMAVVVRDGERPPGRKWLLFNNFYQVIKRRETNRDLPDKKVANLLRNHDKLLKSVHNRLGFVLHARAESSKGAQARLERDEFNALVTKAVNQEIETNEEEIAKTLQYATKTRLVLVNTPDDERYVRFDIRSLQEFFAAEFIYDTLNTDSLRERFKIIFGDSHWREVTHFILSALIEQSKYTEIAIAVEALYSLNSGEDEDFRSLHLRLSRGSLPVARLLQEGVLEQDKRIRSQFRSCLEPLVSSTNIDVIKPLLHISQPNSLSWLINFLISCLEEKSFSESIGAAFLIAKLNLNTDVRLEKVIGIFSSFKLFQFIQVLSFEPPRVSHWSFMTDKNTISSWFLELFLEKVIDEDAFLSLDEQLLVPFFNCIISYQNGLEKALKKLDLKTTARKYLRLLIKSCYPIEHYLDLMQFSNRTICVEQINFDDDWNYLLSARKIKPRWVEKLSVEELNEDLSGLPKIVRFVQSVGKILRRKKTADFLEVLRLFDQDKSVSFINFCLVKYLIDSPLREDLSLDKNIAYLEKLKPVHFRKKINNGFITVLHFNYRIGEFLPSREKFDLEKWPEILEDVPEIGILAWLKINKKVDKIYEKIFFEHLLQKLTSRPHSLVLFSESWGKMVAEFPEHETLLRNLFARSVKQDHCFRNEAFKPLPDLVEFFPLEIHNPEDYLLLPFILHNLFYKRYIARKRSEVRENKKDVSLLIENIRKINHDICALEMIVLDEDLSMQTRASLIIILIINLGSIEKQSHQKLLVDFHAQDIGLWYTLAIIFCLQNFSHEYDPFAMRILEGV